MKRAYFQRLESQPLLRLGLHEVVDQLAFDERGLIAVIAQDCTTKAVLMLAWMNREALLLTLATGRMSYWSRSREQLWVKGETSGHTQALVSMSFDCDGDAILCQVEQQGAACHTNREHCFYLTVDRHTQQVRVMPDAPGNGCQLGDSTAESAYENT